LKTLIGRKYAFLKFTQFPKGSKVLDTPASQLDGFLSRGTCVSSTELNRPSGTKCAFLPIAKPDGQAAFLSKTFNSHKETMF
jgi:hypothetical protein